MTDKIPVDSSQHHTGLSPYQYNMKQRDIYIAALVATLMAIVLFALAASKVTDNLLSFEVCSSLITGLFLLASYCWFNVCKYHEKCPQIQDPNIELCVMQKKPEKNLGIQNNSIFDQLGRNNSDLVKLLQKEQ